MKKVILTGDRPTGRLHVGHYAGKTEYFAGCARLPCLRNRSEQVNNFCSVNDSRAYRAYFLLYEPRNRVSCSAQPHR